MSQQLTNMNLLERRLGVEEGAFARSDAYDVGDVEELSRLVQMFERVSDSDHAESRAIPLKVALVSVFFGAVSHFAPLDPGLHTTFSVAAGVVAGMFTALDYACALDREAAKRRFDVLSRKVKTALASSSHP